jgi:hypothetical protein
MTAELAEVRAILRKVRRVTPAFAVEPEALDPGDGFRLVANAMKAMAAELDGWCEDYADVRLQGTRRITAGQADEAASPGARR